MQNSASAAQETLQATPQVTPQKPGPGEKFRVLVIEDDTEVARLMLLNLARAGLDCRYASDGPMGLSAFKESYPHLILLDLMLPGFDGRALCMQIRENSTVPIIIMTALSGEEPQLQCFRLGADDYVTKPFNPKLLVARVVAHLRRVYAYDLEIERDDTAPLPSLRPNQNVVTQHPATAHNTTTHHAAKPAVPTGFARCGNCGYSGPQQAFQMMDGQGGFTQFCPRCREKDQIVVAL
jgi:DNA-binding response OmpR family regulator